MRKRLYVQKITDNHEHEPQHDISQFANVCQHFIMVCYYVDILGSPQIMMQSSFYMNDMYLRVYIYALLIFRQFRKAIWKVQEYMLKILYDRKIRYDPIHMLYLKNFTHLLNR